MTARELDRMMVRTFGEDYREKSVNGWPLREAFAECGLVDPEARPERSDYGLYQVLASNPVVIKRLRNSDQMRAALAYLEARR